MFTATEKKLLLKTAWQSIERGLIENMALDPEPEEFPEPLRQILASFVTLKINGQLRGCIGTTGACSPLVISVADNAYAAAFRDPRFQPLNKNEFTRIKTSISVLGSPQPIEFKTDQELISQLRPGIDGLIIEKNEYRATFLPAVWESVSEPGDFLRHLKHKAGITQTCVPEKAWLYQAISIE